MRIWPFLLLGACESNSFQVDHETYGIDEVAAGTEVFVYGRSGGQNGFLANIDELDVSPADKAVAQRLTDQKFAIQTLGVGTVHVHGVIEGDDYDRDLDVVPGMIGPMRVGTQPGGDNEALPAVLSPRPTEVGVFAPTHVILEEPIVDANDQPLNGHTIEPWTPQERLVPVKSNNSPVRKQFELTPDATPVAVSVGGETISFVMVEPHTAARFVLVDVKTGSVYDGTTAIPVLLADYFGIVVVALAYDANDRPLIGEDLTAAAPSIPTIEVSSSLGPSVGISAKASGTSSVTMTYDGLTVTFPVITP